MLSNFKLTCTYCGEVYSSEETYYYCPACNHSFNITYTNGLDPKFFSAQNERGSMEGVWKYKSALPHLKDTDFISLGEGNTSLIHANQLGKEKGYNRLYLKNEATNPTGSFKDRPLAVALTLAKQRRMEAVCTASTGNTGVAAAAFSAKAKLPCYIFVPEATPEEKLKAMLLFGANVVRVKGNFSDAFKLSSEVAKQKGWFNLTSTFLNPYALEGDKTVAYELAEQLDQEVPDWILIPIGAGPLLVAVFKAYQEMFDAGFISKLPRMVGIQAANCAPIVRSFDLGMKEVEPWKNAKTVASGIADPLTGYPQDGKRTLDTIYRSNGLAIAVDEQDIMSSSRLLSSMEGLFVEPASATVVAALDILKQRKGGVQDALVVGVLTGHGLKDMKSVDVDIEACPVIEADLSQINTIFSSKI
jgi:threonine synthase